MNRFTRRVTHGMAATAVTGGLVMGFAGVAGASTLSTPSLGARPAAATSTHRSVAPQPESTMGFNLINNSAETLDFVKTTGSLPAPPTAPLTTAQQVNFELPAPTWSYDSGTAYYNVMSPNGTQIGTLQVWMKSNQSWTVSFFDMNGKPMNTMTYAQGLNDNTDIYIEDAVGSPNSSQSLPAASSAEQSFLQATTQRGKGSSSFTDVTETKAWSDPTLIAQAYNGQSVADELTTGKSYTFQTTDTWGVAVTAGLEIKALSASVQLSYSHAITTGTEEDTSYQATVQPGDTTYIWGQVWQYVDTGTFKVKLGNTTWTLPGVTVYSAVPNVALTYRSTEVSGDHPLPAGTVLQNGGSLFDINTGAVVNP
jgi:hypothetical protein